MRKAGAFFLIFVFLHVLFLIPGTGLYAQEEEETEPDEEIPVEPDWSGFMPDVYSRGDQTLNISLGAIFPTVFWGNSGTMHHNFDVAGGTMTISYNYFLDSQFFVGGEISGMFLGTVAKNMYFGVPIGPRVGFQPIIGRFEFPLTFSLGIVPQRYLELNYFGFYMKPGASGYFRFSPNWSFGLSAVWWWLPQWVSDSRKNVYGNFMEVTLSARYHF
jgi:hypothetical protein